MNIPFVKFGGLTVSSFGKRMHVCENILNLNLGIANILLEQVDSVFGFQRVESIKTSRFVFHSSLELLEAVVGRFHFAMYFLSESL